MAIESKVYIAKFLPDPIRGEPRNVGVFVHTADGVIKTRFLMESEKTHAIPSGLDIKEFAEIVSEWKSSLGKYGPNAMGWVGKRKSADQKFYIEFAFPQILLDSGKSRDEIANEYFERLVL